MERIDVELDCTHDIVIKYGVAECQNCGLEESKISKQLTDLEIEREEWQAERMYSEEEVLNIIDSFIDNLQDYTPTFNSRQEWFEQFKKQEDESTKPYIIQDFIAGAKSDAAKDYWYKKFWEDYESQFKNQEDGE